MDEPFSLSTEVYAGLPVVVVRGELDDLTSPELEHAIDACPGGDLVVVDLSNIVFVSSAGIHALLRERDRTVALVCPPGNVMRLFEIVRASSRVAIYESLDEAVRTSLVCTV
jgi:anti-anti-sigma factor